MRSGASSRNAHATFGASRRGEARLKAKRRLVIVATEPTGAIEARSREATAARSPEVIVERGGRCRLQIYKIAEAIERTANVLTGVLAAGAIALV